MAAHVLEQIAAKLARADEHIVEVEQHIERFLAADDRALVDYDPPTGQGFRQRHEKRSLPVELSVASGEALHQIRTCLDYLVAALVTRDGGTPGSKTGFPIFLYEPTTRERHKAYAAQVDGITRQIVLDKIKSWQPYHQGARRRGHWLSILKDLNNRDKHESLLLHVVHVRPELRIETKWVGSDFEGVTIKVDDGEQPEDGEAAGERYAITGVRRSLLAQVAFAEWGDTGRVVLLVDGLRGRHQGDRRTRAVA
jgi:hypothetical protein